MYLFWVFLSEMSIEFYLRFLCLIPIKDRKKILDQYLNFEENEFSRIFDQNKFAYWKITVYQPKHDKKGNILM